MEDHVAKLAQLQTTYGQLEGQSHAAGLTLPTSVREGMVHLLQEWQQLQMMLNKEGVWSNVMPPSPPVSKSKLVLKIHYKLNLHILYHSTIIPIYRLSQFFL